MKMLSIALPDEIEQELENISNKDNFVVDALKEKLKRERNEILDKLLIEGYKSTNEEDKKLNKEWEGITLEKW
ncbi:MAG: hypothetical protein HY097_00650 [Nitrospinae bacterium]|nr:hypothetical protein [Nitrospinota bacterium]MBI3815150.1 hypothetical protein [Nitrospinota bacterium]